MMRFTICCGAIAILGASSPSMAETDDTPAGAYLVSNPYPKTADRISVSGDLDWYKANLPAGSTLTWRVYSLSGGPALTSLIYGNPGQTTGVPLCNLPIPSSDNAQCTLTASTSGYYYMVVAGQGTQTGNYAVQTYYTPPVTPPNMEYKLESVSDIGGIARTRFARGQTVRITMQARNTGPVSLGANWVLNLAPAANHADVQFNSDPVLQNVNDKTVPNDGQWHTYSFDWLVQSTAIIGQYDLLGSIRDAANVTNVLDDTEDGPNTRTLGPIAWKTAGLTITEPMPIGQWTVVIHGLSSDPYDTLLDGTHFYGIMNATLQQLSPSILPLRHNASNGTVSYLSGEEIPLGALPSGKHYALFVDWAQVSNIANTALGNCKSPPASTVGEDGYAEATGDALLGLLHRYGVQGNVRQVIGYSRGAVVISELTQRLLALGIVVPQIAFLDGEGGASVGWSGVLALHYSDSGFYAWAGGPRTVNYFDNDDGGPTTQDWWMGPCPRMSGGVPGIDASGNMTGSVNIGVAGFTHADAGTEFWRFFALNAQLTNIGGYLAAPLALNADGTIRTPAVQPTRAWNQSLGTASGEPFAEPDPTGVMNGDFQYESTAGWYYHGGGGTGEVKNSGSNWFLELSGGHAWREHNWLYVAPGKANLRFDANIQGAGGTPSNPEYLRVVYSGKNGDALVWSMPLYMADASWGTSPTLRLPAWAVGDTGRIKFYLEPRSGQSTIDARVQLDNVRLERDCASDQECDDGRFCTGVERCVTGACVPGTNPCLGGSECADSCDEEIGSCFDPPGAACGDPSSTDCDAADTCDGAGHCRPNLVDEGWPCGSSANTECDYADTCDGAGHCVTNLEHDGTRCGSGTSTPCDHPDTCRDGVCQPNYEPFGAPCPDDGKECTDDKCDGFGSCVHPKKVDGTPCGSDIETECDRSDICINGVCDPHLRPDGTPCSTDDVFCNGPEECLAGACVHGGDPCLTEGSVCFEVVTGCCDPASVVGDLNGDGNVDLPDTAGFAECLTGPCAAQSCAGAPYEHPCCAVADADDDGDIDLRDAAAFQRAFGAADPLQCESGWIQNPHNNHCYRLTSAETSWEDAELEALQLGGHLVTVNDQAENDWLVSTFKDVETRGRVAWIGFNDKAQEGYWVWIAGAEGGWWQVGNPASTSFTAWRTSSGEPNDFGGHEDAATIVLWTDPGGEVGVWNDASTYDTLTGIVERD